ncbi:hypothetical protein CS544_02580 [Porphyromonas gingivalis]|uniref:Uncharacterized protein n=2 Tax=Nixviridae TaxID=3424665 RepID=A0AAT9J919_9CAUD|nr:hypothetical protein [Porphyromonas gingivalis]ATR90086.1 hypothetical protein CS544_02580 [Porphyromonas gingivalis]OWR80759.1 hypothetical protein SJDPG11_03225 [Porphyromonas gingivalis SJD11]
MFVDILKYFARFSSKDGVLANFTSGSSSFSAYAHLREELAALEYLNIVPDFVFGPHIDKVRTRVNAIVEGPYLFVDYGEVEHVDASPGQYADRISLAVTVARPMRETSADVVEHLLAMEDCLRRLVDIRNGILALRCASDPYYRGLSEAHTIVPFETAELSSAGWTMLFSRQGFDSLSAKPRR